MEMDDASGTGRQLRLNHQHVAVKALEGIVSAITFLMVAVFVGMTGTITPSTSVPPACVPGDDISRTFFLFEILSFGFYLLSSLVAQAMKVAVTLLAADETSDDYVYPVRQVPKNVPWHSKKHGRTVLHCAQPMMLVTVVCSFIGTFFLLLSMVDAIQLKFGLLSCGSTLAVGATLGLTVLVVFGLLYYVFTFAYAFKNYSSVSLRTEEYMP